MVLLIIAGLWTVFLVSWLRDRRQGRGVNSISSFSNHLSVLERTSPIRPVHAPLSGRSNARPTPIYPSANYTPPRAPMSLSDARRRRRNMLYGLAGVALGSLILVPFLGTLMIVVHVLTDIALVAYLALLARTQHLAAERRAKVRYLPTAAPAAEPHLVLQRTANY